ELGSLRRVRYLADAGTEGEQELVDTVPQAQGVREAFRHLARGEAGLEADRGALHATAGLVSAGEVEDALVGRIGEVEEAPGHGAGLAAGDAGQRPDDRGTAHEQPELPDDRSVRCRRFSTHGRYPPCFVCDRGSVRGTSLTFRWPMAIRFGRLNAQPSPS